MSVAQSRPDFAAHTKAVRATFPEVVAELRAVLGARLVAYLGSVNETRAVRQWADGDRAPGEEVRNRLRVALQVALPLADTSRHRSPRPGSKDSTLSSMIDRPPGSFAKATSKRSGPR